MKKPIIHTPDYERLRTKLQAIADETPQPKPWTEQENQLLREFYGRVSATELAKELNRSKPQIYNQAARLGLKSLLSFSASQMRIKVHSKKS